METTQCGGLPSSLSGSTPATHNSCLNRFFEDLALKKLADLKNLFWFSVCNCNQNSMEQFGKQHVTSGSLLELEDFFWDLHPE